MAFDVNKVYGELWEVGNSLGDLHVHIVVIRDGLIGVYFGCCQVFGCLHHCSAIVTVNSEHILLHGLVVWILL